MAKVLKSIFVLKFSNFVYYSITRRKFRIIHRRHPIVFVHMCAQNKASAGIRFCVNFSEARKCFSILFVVKRCNCDRRHVLPNFSRVLIQDLISNYR